MNIITKPYNQPLPYAIGCLRIQETEDEFKICSNNFEVSLSFLDAVNLRNSITRWSDNKRLRESHREKSIAKAKAETNDKI